MVTRARFHDKPITGEREESVASATHLPISPVARRLPPCCNPNRHSKRRSMSMRPGYILWRPRTRQVCGGLTLAAYLMAALGVPLPAGPRVASATCQRLACGCSSAEACRLGGCCCSPHGAQSSESETTTQNRKKKSKAAQRHQQQVADGTCCKKPCCQPQPNGETAQTDDADEDADESSDGVEWVIGISAMKCRGQSTFWVSAGIVLPAPAPGRIGLCSFRNSGSATRTRSRTRRLLPLPIHLPDRRPSKLFETRLARILCAAPRLRRRLVAPTKSQN